MKSTVIIDGVVYSGDGSSSSTPPVGILVSVSGDATLALGASNVFHWVLTENAELILPSFNSSQYTQFILVVENGLTYSITWPTAVFITTPVITSDDPVVFLFTKPFGGALYIRQVTP
jgi:hypothetical protein